MQNNKTALIWACDCGHRSIVEILLESIRMSRYPFSSLNIQSDEGMTALMEASKEDHIAIASMLISAKARIGGLKNMDGKSALDLSRSDEMRDLLKKALSEEEKQKPFSGQDAPCVCF